MPGFRHHWIHVHPWGGGFFGGPGMLLGVMGTFVWIALMIGLAWAILSLLMPTIRPMLADIFGSKRANISALEILRQRYASGEIDGDTFELMHERLLASYQQEGQSMPHDAGYEEENWIRYKNT